MSKCIATVTMCFIVAAVFTACQKKDTGQSEDGISLACSDVEYSANAGVPMDEIRLSIVPSDFGELLSLIVISDKGEDKLLVPVERDEDGLGASFRVPVHPELQSSGGKVTMVLIDETDNECEPVPFTVNGLPHAPGAYKKLVESIGEIGHKQGNMFRIDVAQMSESELEGNPIYTTLFAVNDAIQGNANPNSLLQIANNDSPKVGEITEQLWQLLDGLVEQSGILRSVANYSKALDSMEGIFVDEDLAYFPSKNNDLVTISSAGGASFLCNTPLHRPSAATLHRLMNYQIENEIYGDGTGLLDAAQLLWGAAGVLATAGGAAEAGKAAGYMGTTIEVMKLTYEMMEGIMPSSFVKLEVDAAPTEFLEDDEKLEGKWEKAMLTAQSRGWSADKAAFNFLLGMLGGRVKEGMLKKFGMDIHEGIDALGDFASSLMDNHLTDELFGNEIGRTGVFEVPPCEFGPTDIADEEWSVVQIIREEQAPVYLVDRYNYHVRDTGEAVLEVAPRGDRFGRRVLGPDLTFFSSDTVIEVKEIEVNISPTIHTVEPGDVAVFKATVTNANDKGVAWEINPPGAHNYHIKTEADGSSVLTIVTSKNESDLPVHIKAISTASQGLRAMPDAPQREAVALLRSSRASIEISPNDCCVEPGESQTFSAIVHNSDNQKVTWSASAGTINSSGVFTAPDEIGLVTITATSTERKELSTSIEVKIGSCDCSAEWNILSFGEKQSSNISQMERAGENGEGRLTKLLFTNVLNGDNVQVVFTEGGPMPGEQGTYPVEIATASNEMKNRSVQFRNGFYVGIPERGQSNAFRLSTLPDDEDEVEPQEYNFKTTVTINEFTQFGSEEHQVWLSGTIQGEVAAWEQSNNASPMNVLSTLHLISAIEGSFEGLYKVRYKNPMGFVSGLGLGALPFVGQGSVYWDACGLDESEITFMTGGNMNDMLNSDNFKDMMDPKDREDFDDFLNNGFEGMEGLEGLGDIMNMFK